MKRVGRSLPFGFRRYEVVRFAAAVRRPANWRQLACFALVGTSGYVLNLVVFASLVALGIDYRLAAGLAFLVAVTNNFALNSRFTFGAYARRPSFEAPRFLCVSLLALLLSLSLLEVGIAGLGLPKLVAQAVAIGLATPFNFVGQKTWTFGGGRTHAG